MNGFVSKLCDMDGLEIPACLPERQPDERRIEDAIAHLALRYAAQSPSERAEAGDLVCCEADRTRYPDGRTILLYPGAALPGAEDASQAALGRAPGDVLETTLLGQPVRLTVRSIVHRTPAEVNDALIASLGLPGVASVADYRAELRKKAADELKTERRKAIVRNWLETMLAESEFVYDEAEMDAYARERAAEFAEQEEDAPSDDELRAYAVAEAKRGWLAEAFCRARGFEPDEAEAAQEAEQTAQLLQLLGESVPPQDELLAEARREQCMTRMLLALDERIGQKMGGSNGND